MSDQPGALTAPAAVATDERRFLGLDRTTIGPALLVLALAVVMGVLLPWIDADTSYDHAVHDGDVAQIAGGITLVPASGWALASGALVGHTRSPVGDTAQTELVDGSVELFVQAAPFAGSPSALLTRVDRISDDVHHRQGRDTATTQRYAVTTRQGANGVAEDFAGPTRQGSVVAFVLRPPATLATAPGRPARVGVEIVVSGPTDAVARQRDAIVAMIRSIRVAS
jgi:hypothetical protein